ncbi:type III secretion system export apparatus subunit SctU [Trinickia dinghuensis]|uniref:Flagellar type III secretion system protein FlhB n=1 Tax=Trinickia dinghuensis TaxID=2291023 RepID=A0A3D8JUH5_9BURK|nr:type III secretion system export apparatus subunit SctU [Trinickia dinghuensis]RDU96753.1 flagellar type III secretion system protein FlhB [Trinickia dinghuensis]
MATEKTEQATPKKLKEARKKGAVARSTDVVAAATLLATLCALGIGKGLVLDMLRKGLQDALDFVEGPRSMQALAATLTHLLAFAALASVAISLVGLVGALIGGAPQVGLQISFEPVMPKLESISPAAGLKRIFSVRSLFEFAKMAIKAAILAVVLWRTMLWLFPLVMRGVYEPIDQLAALLWYALMRLLAIAVVLYIVIGAADWMVHRWTFLRSQRMSKDEIKQEHKSSDGDPKIKQERRKRAREMTRPQRNAQAAVARANVVVVNPTHYAVALRYAPDEYPLPIVLAKGCDAEALRLRQAAMRYDVPIVANPPVARALHEFAVDAPIPEEMFEVVAAILRWVDAIGVHRAPPAGHPAA